jgi:hypothetical protein
MRPEDYAEIERHILVPGAVAVPEPPNHIQRQDAAARALQLALHRSRPKHFITQGETMKGQTP